jgi:2,3-bisphosphoglycerate-dependent phosphoglycerate mutase
MPMRRLFLIRHADTRIVASVPAADWHLSETGCERARTLAAKIKPNGLNHIHSSIEPKALQTAEAFGEVFGVPIVQVPGLQEHERPGVPLLPHDVFERTMEAFFARPSERVFGNETADEARTRFEQALVPLIDNYSGDLVVVTHGTVLTLLVATKNRIDPVPFWKQLRMPSAVSLTLPDMMLEDIVTPAAV